MSTTRKVGDATARPLADHALALLQQLLCALVYW